MQPSNGMAAAASVTPPSLGKKTVPDSPGAGGCLSSLSRLSPSCSHSSWCSLWRGCRSRDVECGGWRVPVPVPQERREVCRRQRCAHAGSAASPALLAAQALSAGLETAPGQLALGRAACGTARAAEEGAAVSASGSRTAGEGGVLAPRLSPSMPLSQGHSLRDLELAGNLPLRRSLLENSSNLLKLKLLMGMSMCVWETESPGPVSQSLSPTSALQLVTSMGRSVPIPTGNRKVLDPQTLRKRNGFSSQPCPCHLLARLQSGEPAPVGQGSGTAQAEKKVRDPVSQDHRVIPWGPGEPQSLQGLQRSPVQLPAQGRVSHRVSPGCPGLHPVGAGKASKDGGRQPRWAPRCNACPIQTASSV